MPRRHGPDQVSDAVAQLWTQDLTPGQIADLESSTQFKAQDISGPLSQRWGQVAGANGRAPAATVCAMPEFAPYPLTQRLVAMHNADKSGHLTFVDYVNVMSALSGNQAAQEKVNTAFNIFNCDERGTISKLDLFNLFRLHTHQQHSDETLHHIVESIYSKHPQGLGISDFAEMLTPTDLAKLALNI